VKNVDFHVNATSDMHRSPRAEFCHGIIH